MPSAVPAAEKISKATYFAPTMSNTVAGRLRAYASHFAFSSIATLLNVIYRRYQAHYHADIGGKLREMTAIGREPC